MKYSDAMTLLRHIRINILPEAAIGLDLAMGVLELVDQPEQPQEKKTAPKKAAHKKAKPAFKPKKCQKCGKEFTPRYGAQKKCDKCKRQEESLKDTAYELVEMEKA